MSFRPPERFESGDLLLRSYQPGDGLRLYRARQSSLEHLRTFMPWSLEETTVEAEEERVRAWRARWLLAEDFTVAVLRRNRFVASSGFMLRERSAESRYAEIGMWVRADAAGRGLGTRILAALVDWSDAEWPWQRLEWRCDTRNLASARVAEHCGFTLEGQLRGETVDHLEPGRRRDTLIYGLMPGDRRPWRFEQTRRKRR